MKASSTIGRGIIRLGFCRSGHLIIKTNKVLPWFTINGIDDWNDRNNGNFHIDELGKSISCYDYKLGIS